LQPDDAILSAETLSLLTNLLTNDSSLDLQELRAKLVAGDGYVDDLEGRVPV